MQYNGIERSEFTPDFITELKPDEVFVFGSNIAGMHGGGAAYVAFRQFGAVMGCGVGLRGQSYAIPTMQGGVETIKPYVDEFVRYAEQHPELFFWVTRIGCGIAGFTDSQMAPLFSAAQHLANVAFPEGWKELFVYTPRPREYYISKCMYYNGDSSLEDDGCESDGRNAIVVDYERVWVDAHFTEDGIETLRGNLEGYKEYGLEHFNEDDGVPVTLKALLWSRFMHWSSGHETAEDFMAWYREWYLR